MPAHPHPSLYTLTVALVLACGMHTSPRAQALPDAGSLRQQIEQPRSLPLPAATPALPPAAPVERKSQTGQTVTVRSFAFAGNSLLSAEQLSDAVSSFTDRPIDFDGLQRAADAVAAAYREAGWLVRAYLPEQDISQGAVLVQIVEARYAGLRFERELSSRVRPAQLEAFFNAQQAVGQPLNTHQLDRALLLADDLPGVSVAGTLAPGQVDGDTTLLLQTTDEPFIYGNVGLDNTGARSTGSNRLTANLNINSPGGRGELVSLNLLRTDGSDYARVALTVPDGANGLRLGVSASSMRYRVIGGSAELKALQIKGGSSSMGLEWSYPLLRTRMRNLYVSGGLDSKSFSSDNVNSSTADPKSRSDYDSNSLRLGLSGNQFDNWGGGGANSAFMQLLWGQLTNMQAHSQIDSIGRGFNKLSYSLSRQQNLTSSQSLFVSLQGQYATQVLDSSEKFYIGGAQSVRAYPVSELGGERGQVLTAEWRWRLAPTLQVTAFADVGEVVQLPAATNDQRTALQLRGQGLSLGWQGPNGLTTTLTLAQRSGTNPRATPAGTDSDGTLKTWRSWLSTSLPF